MSLIKVNNSRCKSCYLCVTTCPKGLIKKSKETNRLGDYLVEFDDFTRIMYDIIAKISRFSDGIYTF